MLVAVRKHPPALRRLERQSMSDCITIQRGYKYRAYPTLEQAQWLEREFGAGRFVYNHFLEARRTHYQQTGTGLSYAGTAAQLTRLKREGEYDWLRLSNSQMLQQKLIDLDTAFVNFFKKRSGYPQFKSRRGRQSFRVPQAFRVEGNRVKLPKLETALRFKLHRPLPEGAALKSVTVSRTPSGKYYVSFLVEETAAVPAPATGEVGIDLGLHSFLATSDGYKEPHPKHLNQGRQKLRRLKRRHSRCKQSSANCEKARRKLARQEEKVAHQRQDFLHRQSHKLVDENQAISVETLAVKNLMANPKLARSIADSGWGEFVRQLEYKAEWNARELHKVDRWFPSTQLCHRCNYRNPALTLADRAWVCPNCGTHHDRDINSAINIRDAGKRTAGRAGTSGSAGNASGEKVSPAQRRRFSKKEEADGLVPSVLHPIHHFA
jgi:putative transposase